MTALKKRTTPVDFDEKISTSRVERIRFINATAKVNLTGPARQLPATKFLQMRQNSEITRRHSASRLAWAFRAEFKPRCSTLPPTFSRVGKNQCAKLNPFVAYNKYLSRSYSCCSQEVICSTNKMLWCTNPFLKTSFTNRNIRRGVRCCASVILGIFPKQSLIL